MAQSLAEINIHLIFSTQLRYAFLNDHIRPNLFNYMAALNWKHHECLKENAIEKLQHSC